MRTAAWIALSAAAFVQAGCYKPLFPKNAPRTQFEAYDRMRNNDAPMEQLDVYGRPEPALRARLSPN